LKSAFQIEYDQNGRVVFIQLARRDDWTVLLEGFDVFRTSAEEVVRRIGAIVPYNPSHNRREPGYSFTFPSIGLSFWRQVLPESPDDEDGRYFDAAAVAVSGYWGF
jgi:hypothetical protein